MKRTGRHPGQRSIPLTDTTPKSLVKLQIINIEGLYKNEYAGAVFNRVIAIAASQVFARDRQLDAVPSE